MCADRDCGRCIRPRRQRRSDPITWPGLNAVVQDAYHLDALRQSLVATHPGLDNLFIDIEVTALRQATQHVTEATCQSSSSSSSERVPPQLAASPSTSKESTSTGNSESEPEPVPRRSSGKRNTKSATPIKRRAYVWRKRPEDGGQETPLGETSLEVLGERGESLTKPPEDEGA